jgi:hypothetical protein
MAHLFLFFVCSLYFQKSKVCRHPEEWQLTVLSYTQAGIFTTKLSYVELNFKFTTFLSYEARNPCLRIGAVVRSVFFFHLVFQCRFCLALALEALLKALVERWLVRLLNVLTNSVGFTFCLSILLLCPTYMLL